MLVILKGFSFGSFSVFFIILSFFFMLRFTQRDLNAPGWRAFASLIPDLGLCGLCFGLAVASKWIGLYAGVGLAVLLFGRLISHLHHGYDDDPATRKKLLTAALIGYAPAAMVLVGCRFALDGVMESAFLAWALGAAAALVCHAAGMILYAAMISGGSPAWRLGWRRFLLFWGIALFAVAAISVSVSVAEELIERGGEIHAQA